jgi:hypothetical protein
MSRLATPSVIVLISSVYIYRRYKRFKYYLMDSTPVKKSKQPEPDTDHQTNEEQSKFHPKLKDIFGGEKSFRLLLAASSGSGKS